MLSPLSPLGTSQFPDPRDADPFSEGLVAIGGDLTPATLRDAYYHGIFPWFNDGDPIMWWSPDPRCVIVPKDFIPSKSLSRRIKLMPWTLRINTAFSAVIRGCAERRAYADGTWINEAMMGAYQVLHEQGDAISVEIWEAGELVGGLYGLKLGQAFFGESMFHRVTDASKAAFFALMKLCAASEFAWVDCQLPNDHLLSLGAHTLSREAFLIDLPKQVYQPYCDWSALYDTDIPLNALLLPGSLRYHAHRLQVADLITHDD